MEKLYIILCNSTNFSTYHRWNISNHQFYSVDQCFQQLFVVTPLHFSLLVFIAFQIGVYDHIFSLGNNNSPNSVISKLRILLLLCITALQLSTFFLDDYKTVLIFKLNLILKSITAIVYTFFVSRCIQILYFTYSLRITKCANIVILLVTCSECITYYLDGSRLSPFILQSLSCLLWLIHCLLHFKPIPYTRLITPLDQHLVSSSLLSDESHSSLSRLFFSWVSPLLELGLRCNIRTSDDLFCLPSLLSSQSCFNLVANYLDILVERYTLMRYLLFKLYKRLLFMGILKFTADILTFLFPIFLNKLLLYLDGENVSRQGFLFALALAFSTFLNAILISLFNFEMSKMSLQVRTVLLMMIYHKLFRVRFSTVLNNFGTGKVLNLANTDIERISNFIPSLFQFISLPIQLIVTLVLLYYQIGLVFISGVIFILCLIPLNKWICNKIGLYSQEMMKWKDRRIKLMSEVMRGFQTIKFHGWEEAFLSKITVLRQNEIKYLKWRKYLDAFCVFFWATTPVIISSLVFGSYAYFLGPQSLTSSNIFTSLALLGMLIMPLNALPWVLNGLMEALVSFRRLSTFVNLSEVQIEQDYESIDAESKLVMQLINCTFDYNTSSELDQTPQEASFQLSEIDLKITHPSFVGIIGKVGNGKSSLLISFLNELNRTSGVMRINHSLTSSGIGYVTQEPWILNSSIRDNILFGKDYRAEFYHEIINACALESDFQMLPNGDQTVVGDHGATLSGGQKSRIVLARAIYQDFQLYLIDEPFASLDNKVAMQIYQKCIRTLLKDKSVVLITNHIEYLKDSLFVLYLENGRITHSILSTELYQNLVPIHLFDNQALVESNQSTVIESSENVENEEEREHGAVKLHVYVQYMRSIGYFLFFIIILSVALMQISKSASDFWLSLWTKHTTSSSDSLTYLYIFIAIGVLNSIITMIRAFVFAYGGVKAAIGVHQRLIQLLVRASLRFFEITSFGIIINRLSSDTFNVDDALPFSFNIFLAQLSGLLASLVITIYGLPWIGLIIVPLVFPYYFIQKYFRATSRELKRLAAVSLSPIYSQLNDTIQGLTTIRSFGQNNRFKEELSCKVNKYNRIQYAIAAVQQWLNLRLQLLAVVITSGVALIAVYLHYYHQQEAFNSGLVGLALVYSLSLTGLLNGTVQSFIQTELDLISVERIEQLWRAIEENCETQIEQLDSSCLFQSWITRGSICFTNVSMRYRSDLDLSLKHISFTIAPGEHVAIVGRTGSGKSSIFQTLFRMANIESGSITIDDVDISNLELQKLRSSIYIIPQEAFLFNGTIRENLDPLNTYRDGEIWTALFSCNINLFVDTLGGLNAELAESGKDLSIGQRHLFCLARAVLNRKKILCMDEVTANIDSETASVLEHLLQTVFRSTTILHIAHKLDSIKGYDRVIVMQDGQVKDICSVDHYVNNFHLEE